MAERAVWCAEQRHPGATYNPWHDATWCACGLACYPGDHARHVACCDGPLARGPVPLGKPADAHQLDADRRRLAAFLADVAARRPQQLILDVVA